MGGGSEAGSHLRLTDSCIAHLEAQGRSRTCTERKGEEDEESKEEEEEASLAALSEGGAGSTFGGRACETGVQGVGCGVEGAGCRAAPPGRFRRSRLALCRWGRSE